MNMVLSCLAFLLIFSLGGCDGASREELYAQGMEEIKKANPYGAMVFFKNALERDPNYYDARYELAKAFQAVNKTELAENELVVLLQRDPSRDSVRLELARLYIINGKPEQAIKETSAYVQKHGASSETHELLGIASLVQNHPAAAESYFLQALSADPGRTKVKRELAAVYVQFRIKEKEGEARRLISEILQVEPRDTGAYYLLADIENFAGNRDKALAHYQMIVNYDPGDFIALYKVGILQVVKGHFDVAAQIAQILLQKFPKRSEGSRLLGIVNYHKNSYADAITHLLRSVQLKPSEEATYFLGLSYYRKDDLESALSQFYKLTGKTKYAEPSRLLVGIILLRQQRIDDAIAETKKLLAIQPQNALAHNLLGSALMAKGLYEEGIKEFNRAIALDPSIVDAHLKKGVFHLQEGRLSDAESDFSAAVQAAPHLLNTRQILACFYLRENQPERAIEILKEGLSGEKSDATFYDNLAAVRFSQNKRQEALSYLLKAQEMDPEYLAAKFHLANYYVVMGEPEQALKEYRRLLEKDSRNLAAWLCMAALLEISDRDAEALDAYQRGKESKEGPAYLALADYLLRKSRQDEAVALLDEAIQVSPRNLDAQQLKFRIHIQREDFTAAIRTAKEIELIDPQLGLRRKIESFIAMKDKTKAHEEAERFVTLHPDSAFGYMMQAMVHEQWNEYDQAVVAMQNGIRADRDNVEAMVQLGNLHARKKDYKTAQIVYANALRKDANSVVALFAQGALFDDMGEKQAAIKKYLEVLEKADDHVATLNNLAYLYVSGYGRPEEGLRLALLGFRQEPGNPLVLDTLGVALLKNGRTVAAFKILEKAALLLPEIPTVSYHLALAYSDSGKKDQAVKILQNLSTRTDFPEAKEARKIYANMVGGL